MVYDDYADIGIFAKWVMDAPEIGERAHPSVGRRCPCTRKGIKLVLLTIIAISQSVFVWTFQIRKRLRIKKRGRLLGLFYEIKSSIWHPNTSAIFARVSTRGVLVPCSHLLTSFCEQPIFSASCPCVMPDAIRCLAIGEPFPRSLGALRPSIFQSFLLSVIRHCDKIKEERERRRCCSALPPFSLA